MPVIVFLIYLIFALAGFKVLDIILNHKPKPIARVIFAVVWTFSSTTISLLLIEIISKDYTFKAFGQFNLYLTLINLLVIIPLMLFTSITKRQNLVLMGMLAFWFVFSRMGMFFEPSRYFIANLITRVGILGIFAMALLNGFAAVNGPYQNLSIFNRRVTLQDISKAEDRLGVAIDGCFKLKKEAGDLVEIRAQGMFVKQLFIELEALLVDLDSSIRSESFMGLYYNAIGIFFSVYCIFKVMTSLWNIIFRPERGKDPATFILELIVFFWGLDIDIAQWSANLSFFIVGIMAISGIRGLIIHISRLIDTTNFTSDLPVYLITLFVGIYLTSMALMFRLSLPITYKSELMDLFGDVQLEFFSDLFNWVFLLSVIASILLHYQMEISKAKYKSGIF